MKLTEEQRKELKALEQMPEEDIDLSDMPEITDFNRFQRGPFSEYLRRRRVVHKLTPEIHKITKHGIRAAASVVTKQ